MRSDKVDDGLGIVAAVATGACAGGTPSIGASTAALSDACPAKGVI